jgi:effector-binding domain-containing protein
MIKKILLGLAIVLVLFVAIAFVLPSKLDVTQSISIQAPASYVFEEVNDLKNWKKWSYWETQDTTIKTTYSEPSAGVGAKSSWTSADGPGSMTITESQENAAVKFDLMFVEEGDAAKGYYTLEEKDGETTVTVGFFLDCGMNPVLRWIALLMIKPEIEKSFDYQLPKLKEIAEAKPKFTVDITEVNVEPFFYVGISTTMSPQDPAAITAQMGKSFEELTTMLAKAKVEMQGHPFCLYPSFSETSMEMICALPVPEGAKLPSRYSVKSVEQTLAVKAIHMGDYAKMMDTHIQIDQYVKLKKMEMTGAPWERYLTDPYEVRDTAQWVTEIYYPVKK